MTAFIQILGWSLIHSLWQGCLLVLLAAGGGLFLRDRSRHALNGLILFLCLVVPAGTAWRFHRPVSAGPGQVGMDLQILASPTVHRASTLTIAPPLLTRLEAALQPRLPVLVALWALGAGLMAVRLGGGFALSLRWRREGTPAPREWEAVVKALAERMGLRCSVRLLLTRRGDTPMALGLWRPVVLVPVALLTSLPQAYLEALLAHELAHVHRLDYLGNLLQGLAETLLFFHPAVWWLSARIRAEREELADDLAARSLGDPRRLALALNALDDLQPALPFPLFPALAARGGHLLARIERLLTPRPVTGFHGGLLTLLLIPCAVVALRAATPANPPIGAPAAVVAQLDALAIREGVDPQLLRSMAWVESGFNSAARSPLGALGLLQVMPDTARTYGAKDLNDPAQVMAAGAKYLRFLLDRYQGDVAKAVAAYNCGERALEEGRITEEATRYRALVMDVLAAKAVQPEAPLADGEVRGVIRGSGGQKTLYLRISGRGNLVLNILPSEGTKALASIHIGTRPSEEPTAATPWAESRPNVVFDASQAGGSLLIRSENPDFSWRGETRVLLDAPWKTFSFRMEPPKP
ncbi:transglycosylase SLT domain-containing protein [Geothrix sp.]|jgi:beta-lactamase regulating signal transducer with metallopeptidase domain|uniref:M56 family metallopeptidase n=1 Tax=Geothrix sp. TaxID=1962974 RepID=UPI0025BDEFBD|nr:transglycosylase SLT domain-containing protein [Geothrix sp.]